MQSSTSSSLVSIQQYFQLIAKVSIEFLDKVALRKRNAFLADTFSILVPEIDRNKIWTIQRFVDLQRPRPVRVSSEGPAGMNTIGILADRLTILICKRWFLANRQQSNDGAFKADSQIGEIIAALARVSPGEAELLKKVSRHTSEVSASNFEEAYFGLLEANLLMWETQEILYMEDVDAMAADELKDYIKFFTRANMQRNQFIELCEILYWQNGPQG